VLNEVPPTGWLQGPVRHLLSRGARREWFRLRPIAVFPWLFALALMWYARPQGGYFPPPGSIIKAHYPEMVAHAKAALGLYWFCVAVFFLAQALRQPRMTPGRLLQMLLASVFMVFAAGYGLLQLRLVPAAGLVSLVMGVCWLLTVVVAAHHHGRGELQLPLVGVALSVLVALPLAFLDVRPLWSFWEDISQVQTADGRNYHVQRKTFFQGQNLALTEEVTHGPLFLDTRVAATGSGVSHFGYPMLVSPRWPKSPTAQMRLRASSDGRWLALLRRIPTEDCTEAVLVYDRRERKLYPLEEIRTLSPFLVIGPEDELDPDDVTALRGPAPPFPEVLARDLHHPNPRVCALVKELLEKKPAP
jgi:hypothetical protein